MTLVLAAIVAAGAMLVGGSAGESPLETALGTVLQDAAFVGAAFVLASRVGRPTPEDFGLRPVRVGRAVAGTIAALVAFYMVSAVYAALVEPRGEDVLEALGADRGIGYLAVTGFVVLTIAPVAEEVFFRGFFYRSLRNRFSTFVAAALVGILFGVIHYSGPDTLTLLPVLGLLGLVFCLLYEWTGSLYPVIAMHAINNLIAFVASSQAGDVITIGLAFGGATLVGCVLVPAWRARRRGR